METRPGNLVDATPPIQALGGEGLSVSDKATPWPAHWAWEIVEESLFQQLKQIIVSTT